MLLDFPASESKPIPAIATDKTNPIIELWSKTAVWTYENINCRALFIFIYTITINAGGKGCIKIIFWNDIQIIFFS